MNNQDMKADEGKPQLSHVPKEIIIAIAKVLEYGFKKYGVWDGWRTVEPGRYVDAAYRHMLCAAENIKSVDDESGLPHLWHLACNVAFLCSFDFEKLNEQKNIENVGIETEAYKEICAKYDYCRDCPLTDDSDPADCKFKPPIYTRFED